MFFNRGTVSVAETICILMTSCNKVIKTVYYSTLGARKAVQNQIFLFPGGGGEGLYKGPKGRVFQPFWS